MRMWDSMFLKVELDGNSLQLGPMAGWVLWKVGGTSETIIKEEYWPKTFYIVTTLTEIEAIINTRPLTYVYDEFDSGFTLTPAHFLSSYFFTIVDDKLRCKWSWLWLLSHYGFCDQFTWNLEERTTTTKLFWDIWTNEYLLSLREHSSLYHWGVKNQISSLPQVGQVVIIKDDKMPRWM